jgi:hypothetical protein
LVDRRILFNLFYIYIQEGTWLESALILNFYLQIFTVKCLLCTSKLSKKRYFFYTAARCMILCYLLKQSRSRFSVCQSMHLKKFEQTFCENTSIMFLYFFFMFFRYDNLNVDSILGSKRLVTNYAECLLNRKPCPPEGKDLKSEYINYSKYSNLVIWSICVL